MNLLIAPSISSTDLLFPSQFCKIHPLVVNLFPVKIKQLPSACKVNHFVKNWQKLTNNPMILDIVRGYEIPFILLPRQSRILSLCQLIKETSDLVDQEVQEVEEGCYSSFRSQRGPISQLIVSCEKEGWGESPSSQRKGPEQQYSVSALQDGRVIPIKGNVITRGQNVQDRPEGCILCNTLVSKTQEVCQIPVERPSIRVLLPLIRAFSSFSGFYQVIKSPYFSLEKPQYKNDNLPRRHAPNGTLEDLLMARDTLIFILQHLGFLINIKKSYLEPTSTLEFLGVIVDSGKRETPQSTESLPGHPRKRESNSQGTKQTDWEVIIHSNSSPSSTPPLLSSSTSPDSEINLSQLFRGESVNFGGDKERTVMVERKFDSLQREIFNFSPTLNNNKLRCIITRLGSKLSRPDNSGAMVHGGSQLRPNTYQGQ